MDVPVDDMININPIQILCGAIKQRGDPDGERTFILLGLYATWPTFKRA